ncbi:MAG TPA: FAD-binding protein [Solirubrobacteraceae bacterium]|nr:FAD-binding protein [Solirubrobacteraceae bacterium]
MSTITLTTNSRELRRTCKGAVFLPGDEGWDAARQAWNLAVDQRPAAVVYAVDEDDVVAVVDTARKAGLRVAPQGTGHNAGPLGSLEDSVLLRTSSMRGVEVDPQRRRARVRAGALWQDVVGPAARYGLAPLSGSSPDVGVVGYSLGGGIGWLARRYGLQANSITAVELVTTEGALVRADRDHEPDLFWALRGGGGNFGVVTALEFSLYPVALVQAGAMVWDWTESERVLARWSEWAATAPDEVTTSARIRQLPPFPQIPAALRGRKIVMIDGAYDGGAWEAEEALRPLAELGPEINSFATMPATALIRLHGDPEQPVPAVSDHAMLAELPSEAVEALVEVAGPGSGSPLMGVELRQLGGALARMPAEHGALPKLDAAFGLFCVGMAGDPASAAAGRAHAQRVTTAMVPWATGGAYLNNCEAPIDPARAYAPGVHERLRAIRAQVDPAALVHANHQIVT